MVYNQYIGWPYIAKAYLLMNHGSDVENTYGNRLLGSVEDIYKNSNLLNNQPLKQLNLYLEEIMKNLGLFLRLSRK